MTLKMVPVLFALVLVLLNLGGYSVVQGQQPTSATGRCSVDNLSSVWNLLTSTLYLQVQFIIIN